jgi:hypothetical protein
MIKRIAHTLLFFLFASFSNAQDAVSPDTTNFIDYLNVSGYFTYNGELWRDPNGDLFGLKDNNICMMYHSKVVGQNAVSYNEVIAQYRMEPNHVTLYYDDVVYYVKLKKIDFWDFLKQNTENGKLVSPERLTINGKKAKTYCYMEARTHKLSNNCI